MTGSINDAIVAETLAWTGTPYRHQGTRKGVGCDCLGLVRGVWRAVYATEPEDPGAYARDWSEAGKGDPLLSAARRHCAEKPVADAVPGDLLVFRWKQQYAAKHAGILVGPERFVHAYEGHAVTVSPLVPQWRRRIAGAFAFPERPKE
jgi:NlpC/P60 family putative phage cell wall peptidase